MSRVRIALAATSVVTGFAGAALVLGQAHDPGSGGGGGSGGTTPITTHAPLPRTPPLTLVKSRSRCLVDRAAGVITFRIALSNSGAHDLATRVHPWVGFTNGGEIQDTAYDQLVGIRAAGSRDVEIGVPYQPRISTPNACRVSLDAERATAIAVGQVT